MNACLQWNAPGLSGPEDAPEYEGPTVEELTEQKCSDAEFIQIWSTDIPKDVYALLVEADYATFIARFRYEIRRIAENEARTEFADEHRKFMESVR